MTRRRTTMALAVLLAAGMLGACGRGGERNESGGRGRTRFVGPYRARRFQTGRLVMDTTRRTPIVNVAVTLPRTTGELGGSGQ